MNKFVRLIAAVLVILAILPLSLASAQSNGLSIVPRKDYTIKPGETVNDTLRVTNSNPDQPLNLTLRVIDFEATDETGVPKLLKGANEPQRPWSLKPFVTLPEQVTVGPNQTTNVPIKITIPANQGAGSYYGAVEYSVITEQQENVTNVTASSATLLFVKVPGKAKQQIQFVQFGAYELLDGQTEGSFKSLFLNGPPKYLAYRLKNEGNIAEQPQGSIIIRDFFGKTVKLLEKANPKDQTMLLGQTRRFDVCINNEKTTVKATGGADIEQDNCRDPKLKPGRYSAELAILYGDNGNETREITAKTTFWYLPWWFLAVVVIGLAAIITAILFVGNRVKTNLELRKRRR